MKQFQFLNSKMIMLVLSFVLQLTVIFFTIVKFYHYFLVFYVVSFILSISVVLFIVNSRMNPGYKIAWIILILTFPIFGVTIYLLLCGKTSNKKMCKTMYYVQKEMQEIFLNHKDIILENLKAINPQAYRQANYIKKKSLCPIYENSICNYFSPGESVFQIILDELKKANEYIFLEFFIIESGIFWDSVLDILIKKANKGVNVLLIYDDLGSISTLPRHYDKTLQKLGIQCKKFNPLAPIVLSKLNNRDHRKILNIDGKTAFTGGINLADEYINKKEKHGYWKDSFLMIKGDAVWNFTVMFLTNWNSMKGKKENTNKYYKINSLPSNESPCGYIQPYCDTPLDNEYVSQTVYLNLIHRATDYIYITTPYLIIDNEITTALCIAAKSGVDVRIITPHIPDKKPIHMVTRSFYPLLLEYGVKIYEFTPGFIHSKSFVVDDIYAVVGTVNLDYRSLYLHFECGVWMYQANCILEIKQDFLDTLKMCEIMQIENLKNETWYIRLASSILRIFAPLL